MKLKWGASSRWSSSPRAARGIRPKWSSRRRTTLYFSCIPRISPENCEALTLVKYSVLIAVENLRFWAFFQFISSFSRRQLVADESISWSQGFMSFKTYLQKFKFFYKFICFELLEVKIDQDEQRCVLLEHLDH